VLTTILLLTSLIPLVLLILLLGRWTKSPEHGLIGRQLESHLLGRCQNPHYHQPFSTPSTKCPTNKKYEYNIVNNSEKSKWKLK
jgi:hypothetical protein